MDVGCAVELVGMSMVDGGWDNVVWVLERYV